MINDFFYPYKSMLKGAAWNVQASLEGMGVSTSALAPDKLPKIGALVSGWGPHDKVEMLSDMFSVAAVFLLALVIAAGYALNRKRGATCAILVMSFPGLLNLLGLWPDVNFIPDNFRIGGGGVLGSGFSMLSVLIPCAIFGWSAMIIIVDIVSPEDSFWHKYDHIWVSAALLAGVFFVADSQVNEHQKFLNDTSREFQEASGYLLRQTIEYDKWCQSQNSKSVSCKWAAGVQPLLRDYSLASIGFTLIPNRTEEIYALPRSDLHEHDVGTIRRELDAYNQAICPRSVIVPGQIYYPTPVSNKCYSTPVEFCRVFQEELLDGKFDNHYVEAISNECIVPTLVRLLKYREKIQEKVNEDNRDRHYRWMYYVFFSMLIGAKIANSTTKIFRFSDRIKNKNEICRSLHLASCLFQIIFRNLTNACSFFLRGNYIFDDNNSSKEFLSRD